MTTARADGQQTARKRSNTAQSIFKPPTPSQSQQQQQQQQQTPPTPPALKIGDAKTLISWVHDIKESPNVILNQSFWPGVAEGDMLHVINANADDGEEGFLTVVPKDEGCAKPALQISIPRNVADVFDVKNNGEVTVTRVDPEKHYCDYIELTFADQYLGRNEMWRLTEHLVGQCVYVDQEISFIGIIAAKISAIFIDGEKVPAGYVTPRTKSIFRSLSAKVTIFIQVCRELWEFAGDGERYNEKIVHSFLPALFDRWRDAGTNHIVTIVLISRVFYDASELEYAAGPLRQDDYGAWYKDFYKVITDLEAVQDWRPTLVNLKDSFWAFQRDILLAHHYHRAALDAGGGSSGGGGGGGGTEPGHARLVGALSFAHDGPILEALNLNLNPNEHHYVDRSLTLTGAASIIVTPGTGYYRVNKQLLRLTTTRMLDQGFGLDLVSLAKQPLHQSPMFSFRGYEPRPGQGEDGKATGRAMDPLWGGDVPIPRGKSAGAGSSDRSSPVDGIGGRASAPTSASASASGLSQQPQEQASSVPTPALKTFWWEPFWIGVTFWDRQRDLPFRADRFVARAKMHEVEMMGLLDHDVLASIEVPFLPAYGTAPVGVVLGPGGDGHDYAHGNGGGHEYGNGHGHGRSDGYDGAHGHGQDGEEMVHGRAPTRMEAEQADMDTFASRAVVRPGIGSGARGSFAAVPGGIGGGSGTSTLVSSYRSTAAFADRDRDRDRRGGGPPHRNSLSLAGPRIASIEESPRRIITELPPEGGDASGGPVYASSVSGLSVSPSNPSVLSTRSSRSARSSVTQGSTASIRTAGTESPTRRTGSNHNSNANANAGGLSKFAPTWLYNPFRSTPSNPQVTSATASTSSPSSPAPSVSGTSSIRIPGHGIGHHPLPPHSPAMSTKSLSRSPQPVAILTSATGRPVLQNRVHMQDEEPPTPHRGSLPRYSPVNVSPRDDAPFTSAAARRRPLPHTLSSAYPAGAGATSSTSPHAAWRTNPSQPLAAVSHAQSSLARRWQHMLPTPTFKHEIKWTSLVTPGCLPLTVDYFPPTAELESAYDVFSYDFVIDPSEMRSCLVRPPAPGELPPGAKPAEVRRAWARLVMRGMVAVRLAQGFQFVLRPGAPKARKGGAEAGADADDKTPNQNAGLAPGTATVTATATAATARRAKTYLGEEDATPKPEGAAQVLSRSTEPVYLSMSNEIHRISYTGEAIQVRRYVRRMPALGPIEYECLVWPKLGMGYTEMKATFRSYGLENYGWNRLDMLVAGYEHQFNDSLRYWRTRFVVIPTTEAPPLTNEPVGEGLDDEEIRIMGIEKLAELFTKHRWQFPEDKDKDKAAQQLLPPVRFLPTTLGPVVALSDEVLMAQLDEIHAAGPLKKKMKSEREIGEMPLQAVAKAMLREEDGVPMKMHHWHGVKYDNSFTGFEFVSWLVREFRDVSSREQAVEVGGELLKKGLFRHARGAHGLLDGYYFYQLEGDYVNMSTPRMGWFNKASRHVSNDEAPVGRGYYPGTVGRPSAMSPRKPKKSLILTASDIIDIDPGKKSDQAESVVLHHDIIQNPETVFHFELQWIGTTARCIDDALRQWSRVIERYGLKLVEAYVAEIGDIQARNPFQSCFPFKLAVPPPIVPDLEKRVPEGTQTAHYFEYALLRRWGFIIDVEAAHMYPRDVDVVYQYRRAPFRHSQFVHRSGVAFVQVLSGSQGFLFLTNRLMAPGRLGNAHKGGVRPGVAAEEMRQKLYKFCCDKEALIKFYDEVLDTLGSDVERFERADPPPLSI
ncbi:hypothetical protein CONPUDRAFT_87316 [Coniophora puteana RWD-64-598 SS2]|uniref:Vacuolar membrane-associated protein IML1 n=1 Tax=Coniophora puteana (strain RWD-64-598) TaxID=741705 RepID=A0A5M3N0J7_CONPW|nr:uncharacterized protein CONPUDRAFT_87316 [Coniophora puteana RWD-64-598 SS2]EIW84767.1 hypothetical protein CONPUDRAFT_87316 [Coniophora puteana RWD-64-598 SS2]